MPVRETVLAARVDKASIANAAKQLNSLAQAGKVDPQQFKVATANLNEMATQVKVVATELTQARKGLEGLEGDELDKQRAKVAKLEKLYIGLGKRISDVPDKLEDAYNRAAQAEERVAKKQQDALERQKRLVAQKLEELEVQNRISERYDVGRSAAQRRYAGFGDFDTGLQEVARNVGGTAGGTIAGVGDAAALTEQLGLMGEAAVETAKGITDSTGALGNIARQALYAVPALGAAGAGFAAIAVAAIPIALIAGGAALAINKLNEARRKEAERAEQQRQTLEAVAGTYAEFKDAIQQGDIDGAASQYGAALAEFRKANIEYNRIAEAAKKNPKVFKESLDEAGDALRDASSRVRGIREAAAEAGVDLEALERRTGAAAEREKELADKREKATQTIAQLNEREADLQRRRAQAEADLAEDRGVRNAREQEDYAEQVAKTQERIQDIQIDSSKRIAEIRADSAKQEVAITKKTQASLADTIASTSKSIADVQIKAQADSAKSYAKYLKDRQRQQEDYQDQSFNAIINNDVLSLKQAQIANQKKRQRDQEDFDAESAERQAQAQQRITEIQNESAIRITEIKAGALAERQELAVNLRERIAGEKKAVAERLASEEKAAQEQEKARAKRLERQAEDDKRADDRSKRAHEEELQRIDAERQAQQQALLAVQQGATNVISAVGQSNTAVINATGRAASAAIAQIAAALNNRASGGSGPIGVANKAIGTFGETIARRVNSLQLAEGAIVPENTHVEATFEGKRPYKEAVIPLNRQTLERVLPNGLRGGPNVEINGGIHIGAGNQVTPKQVRDAVIQGVGAVLEGTSNAIQGVS